MDPQLQQLLMALGQRRLQDPVPPGAPGVYPPLGQSMMPNNGVIPTTSTTNDLGQVIDEQGNPLQSYARGERPFGNANVGGGQASAMGAMAQAPMGGMAGMGSGNRLLEALKGVSAPRPPDVVKPSTPHLPPLRPIEGGGLVQLMASLGIAPKDVPGLRQSIGRS